MKKLHTRLIHTRLIFKKELKERHNGKKTEQNKIETENTGKKNQEEEER